MSDQIIANIELFSSINKSLALTSEIIDEVSLESSLAKSISFLEGVYMGDKIYKDSIGVTIDIDMGEDISDITDTSVLVKKGEGSADTWTFTLSGTQHLQYTTVDGDLDEVGMYYLQPDIDLTSWEGKTKPVTFKVYDDWE